MTDQKKLGILLRAMTHIERVSTHIDNGVNHPGDLQISKIWRIAERALTRVGVDPGNAYPESATVLEPNVVWARGKNGNIFSNINL